MEGLEPTRLTTTAPKAVAAANYATHPIKYFVLLLYHICQQLAVQTKIAPINPVLRLNSSSAPQISEDISSSFA